MSPTRKGSGYVVTLWTTINKLISLPPCICLGRNFFYAPLGKKHVKKKIFGQGPWAKKPVICQAISAI